MDRQIRRLRITFMDGLSAKLSVAELSLGSLCKRYTVVPSICEKPSIHCDIQ